MKVCICGTVKNVGEYLPRVLENMEKIASIFEDYVIILYYDKSKDNTLQIMKKSPAFHRCVVQKFQPGFANNAKPMAMTLRPSNNLVMK